MHLTFNSSFNWYYGIDGNTPSNKHDLLSVVLHEIGHGLGFSGSAKYSGGSGSWDYNFAPGKPDIYDTFMKDGGGTPMTQTSTYPNPSTVLGTLLTSNDLWFTGYNAKAANNGTDVKIYAPSSWSGGSSYSHLDYNTFNNTPNQLMVYAISTGESIHSPGEVGKGLLKDLGWEITGTIGIPSITTPTSGSILSGSTQVFQLDNSGVNVDSWGLWVGSTVGSYDIALRGANGSATSITINNLPTDGSTIYVRLRYKENGTWKTADDYTYIATTASSIPSVTSPIAGSTLSSSTQSFTFDKNGINQLFNVLKGDMSLVGPRPEVPEYVKFYTEEQKQTVLSVPPGITDLASIEFRNENDLLAGSKDPVKDYREKVLPIKLKYYEQYVTERSLWLDFKLIIKTIIAIVT